MLKKLLVVGAAVAALGTAVAAPAYAADPRKDGGHRGGHYDGDYESFKYFKDNDYTKHEYNSDRSENDTELNQILPIQVCGLINLLAAFEGDCTNGPDISNVEIDRR